MRHLAPGSPSPPLSPTPHQHPTTAARRTALGERETPTISPPPATSFKARRSQLPLVTRYWSTATAIGPGGLQLTCGAGRWAERTVLAQQQAAGADELALSERATQHGMVSLHCCPAPSCYDPHCTVGSIAAPLKFYQCSAPRTRRKRPATLPSGPGTSCPKAEGARYTASTPQPSQ